MPEASVTPSKPTRVLVRNDSEIRDLEPSQKAFHATVPDAKGLRLKVKPTGSKLWEVVAKGPDGKAKTRGIGSFPEVPLSTAVERALNAYRAIKEGIDPAYQRQKTIKHSKAISKAKQPIIQLAMDHVEQRVNSGDVKPRSADNDYRSIRQIQSVIGHCTFLRFGLQEAKALANAFPEDTAYAARDKTKKMIAKTYRGLDQATQREIDEDIPRLLNLAYGTIRKRTRAEQTISTNQIGEFWKALISTPSPNPLHKEALVLALLTGERKEAILRIETKNIHIDEYQCIYVEGKTSRGTPTKNLIPLTPILGTLVERMKDRATSLGSTYLFPKQRLSDSVGKPMSKPHMTEINKTFIESLGTFEGVRPGAHNLRRTLANVAATILGSQDLAQEHILHFNKHTSGAKRNYFDQASLDFLETRRDTFERCHQRIDDLILESLEVLDVPLRENDEGTTASATAIVCGETPYPLLNENDEVLTNENMTPHRKERIYSPLGSFASNEITYVSLSNRPRCQTKILDYSINFYAEKPTVRFKDRIQ